MNILLIQQLIPTSNAESYVIFIVLVSLTSTIINECPEHENDIGKKNTLWHGNWTTPLHAVTNMTFHTCWVAMYSSRIILRIRLTMLPTDACSGSDFVSFLPSALTSAMRSLQYENEILGHCGPNIHQYMGIPDGFTTYCAVCQFLCAITSFSKLTVLNAMSKEPHTFLKHQQQIRKCIISSQWSFS